ncbi:MAG: hypothetical protein ACK4RK_04365 [Gemmataceae bacterium]
MPRRIRSLGIAFVALCLAISAAWQAGRSEPEETDTILPVLREEGPRFWKGNLHTHSFWSDGDHFPEMIADWYKRHGYHFLALTDHNVLSEGERWMNLPAEGPRRQALEKYQARFGSVWVEQRKLKGQEQVRLKPLAEFRSLLEEPGRFLLIPGEEITHRYTKYPVHINAINLRDVLLPIDGDSVAETMQVNHRQLTEQRDKSGRRMIAFVNHPNFGWGIRAEDMVLTEEMRFFEVYNGHPSVRNEGDAQHPSCERMWDIVLALRLGKHRLPVVYGLATDDAHRYHQFGVKQSNPGRGWVMARAPYLSAEGIVRALEAGDFYASTGVTLNDIQRQGDQLVLSIRAEPGVTYRTQFIATLRDASLDSEPLLDNDGQPLPVTRVYSADIGQVVAESTDTRPVYRFTGKELYIRAKVISSKPHPNPYRTGDVEVAWTQPVLP